MLERLRKAIRKDTVTPTIPVVVKTEPTRVKCYIMDDGGVYTIPIPVTPADTPLSTSSIIILELMEKNENLHAQIAQLEMMVKNGLGSEDIQNDISPMHEM